MFSGVGAVLTSLDGVGSSGEWSVTVFFFFSKSFRLLYFESLVPILAFYAVVFTRYPFLKPWHDSRNDTPKNRCPGKTRQNSAKPGKT